MSKKLRDEISDLLIGNDDPVEGIAAAAKRVEELKELARVWKGTAEERGRVRFVEGLARMVEDRHAEFLREREEEREVVNGTARRRGDGGREEGKSMLGGSNGHGNGDGRFGGGFDLFNRLQNLRGAS